MRRRKLIEFLHSAGVAASESLVARLLGAEPVGSGNYRDYTLSDARYVIMYYRWQELTGYYFKHDKDARMAAAMARHRNTGWVVKTSGTMFWTKTPWYYVRSGAVAVRVPE